MGQDRGQDTFPAEGLTALLERAASGEDSAWSELIQIYGRRVFALARSRLRSHDAAEEVTQSVFVSIARKLTAGEYEESGRFEAWLFRVAMNRIRDEIRRRRRSMIDSNAHLPEPSHLPSPGSTDPEDFAPLRRALEELSDADREIIELRHHGQLSFRQIAAMTGEPVGTLLARHHRALRKLKGLLEKSQRENEWSLRDERA
ncbi:MAG: RNA polymerase sigma factor [Phycisphaerales bacterium]